jgi:hypothetical protein
MRQRGPAAPTGRRIYMKGAGRQAMLRLGDFRFTSPILNRRRAASLRQFYARATMAVAAWFTRTISADELDAAKEIAGAGGWTWKDVYISHLYGTLFEVHTIDGEFYQGRRILSGQIQALLDSLSSEEGAMLVRTPLGWACLLRGNAGEVMTMDEPTMLPQWKLPAAQSGGSDMLASPPADGVTGDGTGGATVGEVYIGLIDIKVKSLMFGIQPNTNPRTYRALIANLDSAGKLVSVLSLSPTIFTNALNVRQSVLFSFPGEPTLVAGSKYAFCLVRTDSTTSAQAACVACFPGAGAPFPGLPTDIGLMTQTYGDVSQRMYWLSNTTTPANVAKNSSSVGNMWLTVRFTI